MATVTRTRRRKASKSRSPDPAWLAYKTQPSVALRNQLAERYFYLVKYHAARMLSRLPQSVDLDDLIADGTFGLLAAIDAFDLDRGFKFETYCVLRIRGAILDGLREGDWVPRKVRSQATKLGRARLSLEERHGREPTPRQLARELGLSVPELEKLERDTHTPATTSLNKVWFENESFKDLREIDVLQDKRGEDPQRRSIDLDVLRRVCRGLNKTERLIIIGYYYEGDTMKQIGRQLDLSESRICQLHSAMLVRIRQDLAGRVA